MATPMWIRKSLKMRGVPFQERQHPEAYTAQQVAQREHMSGHRVAKVVAVMADDRPVELILPASRQVDLDRVQAVLGSKKVRLANEAELEATFEDCELGAIPALRHWEGVEVLMDRSLNVEGDILFQAGTHSDAIEMKFTDWYEMVKPRVATFAVAEPAHA
jgi:Ala-tRNA(Pro) deacylase